MTKHTYSYEEVLGKSIQYFGGDELAASSWVTKYAMKDPSGRFLEADPEDMHKRLARSFARKEKHYYSIALSPKKRKLLSAYGQTRKILDEKKIFSYFRGFSYIVPQGSVMSSLGNPYLMSSLSNCVVLPEIYDSYGGILYTDQQLAQLFKRRCGVGIDISTLRPSGMFVLNAAGSTSGAVSFMERFSNTTREVAQNGRRGALMITLDIAHPDSEQFITSKQDLRKITGANISVKLSDAFMHAVESNKTFTLRYPVTKGKAEYTRTENARHLWNTIIGSAHKTAEPGVIFWDRQHRYSTSSIYPGFENISTNPCSEIAMQGGDSCRLIAINLYTLVIDPFTPEARFDHEKFYEVVYEAQRLMDDLVDLELETIERILKKISKDPEPGNIKQVETDTWKLIHANGKKGRRTGLGFTALADTLAGLGLAFDSADALEETERIMRTKCMAEFDSTIDMAIERGSFSAFNPRTDNKSEFTCMMRKEFPEQYSRMMKYGRRNISLSTVAPTGTLSLLTQSSSGLEPVFMLSYTRRRKVNADDNRARVDFTDPSGDSWQEYTVYHPGVKRWMEKTGLADPALSPYKGSTASEIDWKKRIQLQSIVQKYTTHSISSTINLPATATVEQIGEIYLEAWKKGLKGITVYREGSRSGVLISNTEIPKPAAADAGKAAPLRPDVLDADVIRFLNGAERWVAVVGLLHEKPYEIFTGREEDMFSLPPEISRGRVIRNKPTDLPATYDFQYLSHAGKSVTQKGLSTSFNEEFWNYARLISGVLRQGMPLPQVISLVSALHFPNTSINSWKAGVERALRKYVANGTPATDHTCEVCGDPNGIIFEEGCLKCKSCGNSLCG